LSNGIRLPHAVLILQAGPPSHIVRGHPWGRPPRASVILSDDRSMIHSAWGAHSTSQINEWMGWSRDVRSPDDADPVDSPGAFNRLSALMSGSTSYTVRTRIRAIRMLKLAVSPC